MIRAAAERLVESLRRHTPLALVPLVVQLRFWISWSRGSVRGEARRQMRFLLEHARPDADLDEVARGYLQRMIWRGEARWRPSMVTEQRVVGIEHLAAARDRGLGVMVNYMHHGAYDGAFPSMARHGVTCQILVYPYMVEPDAAGWMRQHVRIAGMAGGTVVSAAIGTKGVVDLLSRGEVVAIATDVPGSTAVTFVGRELRGSFGAARIAVDTGSPLVLMTAEKDEQGPYLRIHEALDPTQFESARALLLHLIAENERAVLAWPEAYDLPLSRWATPDGKRAG